MLTPAQARAMCADRSSNPAAAGLDATMLTRLLSVREPSGWTAWTDTVPLHDEQGWSTDLAVHVPEPAGHRELGALVVLHGAGGHGELVLPKFTALGDRLGMAVLCPTAGLPPTTRNSLNFAGVFGKRFARPSWDLCGAEFPHAALRWARAVLGVDPDRCVLMGVSMGAIATWNLAMRFSDEFAAVVPINGAPSLWEAFGPDRRTQALLPNVGDLPLFVVHGAQDEQIPVALARRAVADLRARGHPALEYVEVPDGEHALESLGLDAGSPLFERLAAWLAPRRRSPEPAAFTFCAAEPGGVHWLRLRSLERHQVAEAYAARPAPNQFVVEVSGAREVEVRLGSDTGTAVSVSVNGVITRVLRRSDVGTVAETFRGAADPRHTADQIVTLAVPDARPPAPTDRSTRGSPC